MKSRYVARYDGKSWGVWDRSKNDWRVYPTDDSEAARRFARCWNAPDPSPITIKAPARPPEPVWTNRPTASHNPTMESLDAIMQRMSAASLRVSPRDVLVSMMAGMQEEMEELREQELARLPLQPMAVRICPHCADKELNKRSRN